MDFEIWLAYIMKGYMPAIFCNCFGIVEKSECWYNKNIHSE